MFYNTYYISKDEIHIVRSDFGDSGSYSWIFWARFQGQNTYTGSRRGKRVIFVPIQVHVLKHDENHYRRDFFNVIPQILS